MADAGLTSTSRRRAHSQQGHIKSSVTFLGHLIDGEGIQPDPGKITAIGDFHTPQCVGDIRRFLGMGTHSLTTSQMSERDRAWVWGEAQRQSFKQI